MLAARFRERRRSSDTYTPCSGLFPSHKFQGPLATHYVVLIYGGQILFIAGVILAVVGFTAKVPVVAYLGPVIGSVGLCMATAGCTVHKRSSMLRNRRIGLSNGDNYNPDSPRDVYKQLAAAVCCMGTLLGIIFMAVGLANDKNDGDSRLTLYFEILGPLLIVIGVVGLLIIKGIDAKEKRRLRKIVKEKRSRRRTTIKGHMATHTIPQDVDPNIAVESDLRPIQTISQQVNNNYRVSTEETRTVTATVLYPPDDAEYVGPMFSRENQYMGPIFPRENEFNGATCSFLNVATPAPPRVTTPLPPSDKDNETQFQWQNAYTFSS